MSLNFLGRRKILKHSNYLDLTPYRLFNEEVSEDGFVNVLIPKFTNPIAVKYLTPRLKSPDIKIKLDEIGSAVWMELNGKQKVGIITKKMESKFGEKISPVNERLTTFLTQLYMQKYISFKELD
jgi:hypothetical protein